jgi:sialic acid synthase SpsE
MEMLNGMFEKMAEESIYQRKMIKKSEILSIKNIWSFI